MPITHNECTVNSRCMWDLKCPKRTNCVNRHDNKLSEFAPVFQSAETTEQSTVFHGDIRSPYPAKFLSEFDNLAPDHFTKFLSRKRSGNAPK